MSEYLWLCVETDEYELPLAVADTARELGEIFGVKTTTIIADAYRKHDGRQNGYKYVKVRNDGE